VSIANGGSATCTITNNDKKAQPSGTTAMCWVLKDTLNMTNIRTGTQCGTAATVTFSCSQMTRAPLK